MGLDSLCGFLRIYVVRFLVIMMDSLVSVIIPVYNGEKTIRRCIDSLLRQSYQKLEIICVDDASTDKTGRLLYELVSKDNRVQSIRLEENKGADNARFVGIKHATGDYISFVDPDDWLPENALMDLVNSAVCTNADIVEGNITRVIGRHGWIRRYHHRDCKTIVNPELFEKYFISFFGINILNVAVWGKLYNKTLFENPEIRPSNFRIGEDLLLSMELFLAAERYVMTDDNVYYYRYGGVTSRYNPYLYQDLKAQYYIKLGMINKYGYEKALCTTKIEMCNVLRSQVKQMLLYNKPYSEIDDFLNGEIQSGFIDEITRDIPKYPAYYSFLEDKDVTAFILSEKKGLWKQKISRYVKNVIATIA